jgi:hypothetical protein
MRKFLTLCALVLSLSASAQWQLTGSRVRYVNGIGIPTRDTSAMTPADSSQILIRPQDSSLYVRYRRAWMRVGGGGGSIGGTGTINYVPKFTASGFIGNSQIIDNGSNVLINTTTDNGVDKLQIRGSISQTTSTIPVENTVAGVAVLITNTFTDFGVFGTKSNHHLGLITNNSVKATITPAGQFNIGGNYVSTNNTLQVAGNAAIGYTTAAPTNGLIVNGRVLLGTTTDNGVDALQVNGSARFTGGLSAPGTSTFGAGGPTSIDGTDGRIITDKFRMYNSVPASQYHDFTSSATSNRTITIPNVSGTMTLGTGAAGQVTFFTSTNNVSSDNNLFWDNTNKRLGIGDPTAPNRLSVYEDVNGVTRLSLINPNTGTSARTFFYTLTTGNRYIGFIQYGANATGTTVGLSNASLSHLQTGGDSGPFLIEQGNITNPMVFATNGSERLRITSGGRTFSRQ